MNIYWFISLSLIASVFFSTVCSSVSFAEESNAQVKATITASKEVNLLSETIEKIRKIKCGDFQDLVTSGAEDSLTFKIVRLCNNSKGGGDSHFLTFKGTLWPLSKKVIIEDLLIQTQD